MIDFDACLMFKVLNDDGSKEYIIQKIFLGIAAQQYAVLCIFLITHLSCLSHLHFAQKCILLILISIISDQMWHYYISCFYWH